MPDNRVYVYHRATGRKLFALPGHQNVVNTVAWNPVVHTMFASGSDDGTVRVWTNHPQDRGVFVLFFLLLHRLVNNPTSKII